jgi:hypothetical protein
MKKTILAAVATFAFFVANAYERPGKLKRVSQTNDRNYYCAEDYYSVCYSSVDPTAKDPKVGDMIRLHYNGRDIIGRIVELNATEAPEPSIINLLESVEDIPNEIVLVGGE